MLNIVLLCDYGASSGMLAKDIKNKAQNREIDCDVNAYSYSEIANVVDAADIILLGPQIRFRLKTLQAKYPNKKFMVIDARAYGTMDGDKVLNATLKEIE